MFLAARLRRRHFVIRRAALRCELPSVTTTGCRAAKRFIGVATKKLYAEQQFK
jgi:hypothetical protein